MWQAWIDVTKLVLWTALVPLFGLFVGAYASGSLGWWKPGQAAGPARVALGERVDRGAAASEEAETRNGTEDPQPQDARASAPLGSAYRVVPGEPLHRGSDDLTEESMRSPFVRVAQRVLPSVVSVEVRRWISHPDVDGLDESEMFAPGSGSGFVFDQRGYVLTNAHVVGGAARIWVEFDDGRQLPATLVGSDPDTDVAVLHVEQAPADLALPLGNSETLQIGDWVAAVGNPLGYLNGSVTAGVVSGKGRNEISIRGGTPTYQDFIQTDASINFGNSGGPLVDRRGNVVGINTAFAGRGSGIGFAIPIDLAREVADELIAEGRVVRGYLGIMLQPLDPDLAEGLGAADGHGVIVREVFADTPADKAGLRAGDLMVRYGDHKVIDLPGFRMQVARSAVGRPVPLEVRRFGEVLQLEISPQERPAREAPETPPPPAEPEGLGLSLSLVDGFGDEDFDGSSVQVDEVSEGSLGEAAGLRPGDLILNVGRQRRRVDRDRGRGPRSSPCRRPSGRAPNPPRACVLVPCSRNLRVGPGPSGKPSLIVGYVDRSPHGAGISRHRRAASSRITRGMVAGLGPNDDDREGM